MRAKLVSIFTHPIAILAYIYAPIMAWMMYRAENGPPFIGSMPSAPTSWYGFVILPLLFFAVISGLVVGGARLLSPDRSR